MRTRYVEELGHCSPSRTATPYAPCRGGEEEFVITPELSERMERHLLESDFAHHGLRGEQNLLCPWDPERPFHEPLLALVVTAAQGVVRQLHAERFAAVSDRSIPEIAERLGDDLPVIEELFGMSLAEIVPFLGLHAVRLVGGEVRANTPRFIDVAARIHAAHECPVLLHASPNARGYEPGIGTLTRFMARFLTFKLGLAGGDYFSAGWGSVTEQAHEMIASNGHPLSPALLMPALQTILGLARSQGYSVRLGTRSTHHLWTRLNPTAMARLYCRPLRDTVAEVREAMEQGMRIGLDTLGGAGYRSVWSIFHELSIHEVFDPDLIIRAPEDAFFHGVGLANVELTESAPRIRPQNLALSCPERARSANYETLLAHNPPGQVVMIVAPDGEEVVLAQVVPRSEAPALEARGIAWIPLDEKRRLALHRSWNDDDRDETRGRREPSILHHNVLGERNDVRLCAPLSAVLTCARRTIAYARTQDPQHLYLHAPPLPPLVGSHAEASLAGRSERTQGQEPPARP